MLNQTTDHRHRVLASAAKHLRSWFIKVKKIKAIYHTLNMLNLDVTNKCLIAECWIPTIDMGAIRGALIKGTVSGGSVCVSRALSLWEQWEDGDLRVCKRKETKPCILSCIGLSL